MSANAPYNPDVSIAPTPARVRLPRLDPRPATIFDFLCAHFPHIGRDVWLERIRAGSVHISVQIGSGLPVTAETPYRPGAFVHYFREVANEAAIPFAETVLYEDERLLVADKPHFIPVTPSGNVVNECLLFRLQRRTGLKDLAPIHRLDRDTAGLVLFSKRRSDRAAYSQLFAEGQVEKKYLAVASVAHEQLAALGKTWLVEDRLEPEPGSFRMMRAAGEVNARTKITLAEVRAGLGLFELQPATGKKHQLRIHMMSLGFPIWDDPFYPELRRPDPADFSRPMQLLASELIFLDPVNEERMHLQTQLRLNRWELSA